MTELRNYTIQFRKDTAANWQRWNPVLGEGEPGYDTTANRFKVGDGVSAWNSLPFHQGSAYDIARDKGFVGTETQWIASLKGEKGDKGDKGDRGIAGVGIKGDKGDRGPKGDKGDKGDTGVGLKGDKGDKGEEGRPGTGIQVLGNLDNTSQLPTPGKRGDAYAINSELWVWSPSSYTWVNAGTIRGEKGDKGDKGDTGEAGILVSETSPTEGQVWIDPSSGDAVLKLPDGNGGYTAVTSIKGEKGDPGDKGDKGLQGLQGIQGLQGLQGEKGDTGPKGDPGEKGEKGDPGPKGDKGEPGNNGTIENITTDNITDAGTVGKALMKATTVSEGRSAIGADVARSSGTASALTAGTSTTQYVWSPKVIADYVNSKIAEPVTYDSGWRDISGILEPSSTVRAGKVILLRRIGDKVILRGSVDTNYWSVGRCRLLFPSNITGMAPSASLGSNHGYFHGSVNETFSYGEILSSAGYIILYYNSDSAPPSNNNFRLFAEWYTTEAVPELLPGTPYTPATA